MKKLLALILALACIFAMAACNDNNNGDGGNEGELTNAQLLQLFSDYISKSAPTGSVVTSTTTESKNVLVSTVTLSTGKIASKDGAKAASKLVTRDQTFSSIESGMLNLINENVTEEWYLEGKGISTTKGRRWDASGTNFAPVAGSLQLNLAEENFSSITYNKEKSELILVCPADTAASVIGFFLPGDYDHYYETTVTLTAFGDKITGIKISYAIDDRMLGDDIDSSISVEYTTVEIDASYSYGLQSIDFNGYQG